MAYSASQAHDAEFALLAPVQLPKEMLVRSEGAATELHQTVWGHVEAPPSRKSWFGKKQHVVTPVPSHRGGILVLLVALERTYSAVLGRTRPYSL